VLDTAAAVEHRRCAGDHAGAKVLGQLLLGLLIGLREQPHHHEERHHRRHEVGVGHLPSAAVVSGVAFALLLDDDDASTTTAGSRAGHYLPLSSANAFSSSGVVGRSSEKILRRANSMAICGLTPRAAATTASLMQSMKRLS